MFSETTPARRARADRRVVELVAAPRVRVADLQAASFGGVPDEHRAVVWRLLLGYLPPERAARAPALAAARRQYRGYVAELVPAAWRAGGTEGARGRACGEDGRAVEPAGGASAGAEAGGSAATDAAAAAADAAGAVAAGAGAGGEDRDVRDGADAPVDAGAGAGAGAGADEGSEAGAPGAGDVDPTPDSSPEPEPSPEPAMEPAPEPEHPAPGSDAELSLEIAKDVERTYPDLAWFAVPAHAAALRRVLFVYAKLNAGVRYVQGMHEVLAPLLYVMATERADAAEEGGAREPAGEGGEATGSAAGDSGAGAGAGVGAGASSDAPSTALADAEADTFHVFMALMVEVRDLFIMAHDHSETGVRGVLDRFARALARREPAVAARLAGLRLEPQFYALRWCTTLLAREFDLPSVLVIWDGVLADPDRGRLSFLLHFAVGMVRAQRAALLKADFGTAMRTLQHYPPGDFLALLATAMEVRAEENHDAALAAAAAGGGGGGGGVGGGGVAGGPPAAQPSASSLTAARSTIASGLSDVGRTLTNAWGSWGAGLASGAGGAASAPAPAPAPAPSAAAAGGAAPTRGTAAAPAPPAPAPAGAAGTTSPPPLVRGRSSDSVRRDAALAAAEAFTLVPLGISLGNAPGTGGAGSPTATTSALSSLAAARARVARAARARE